MTNAEKVHRIIRSCTAGRSGDAESLLAAVYKEHNTDIEDGRDMFVKNCKKREHKNTSVRIRRTITDGDLVAVHSSYTWRGDSYTVFDIFRFENGLAAEHWSNMQFADDSNLNDHTMTDGASRIENPDKTAANKELVRKYIIDVYIEQNIADIDSFLVRKYVEHDPDLRDGRENFKKDLMDSMTDKTAIYHKLHFLLGEGNFVLTVCEGAVNDENSAFYDLFRIHEEKIAEHWNVVQQIPATGSRKNRNEKF